ncbi:MAG TPA: PCRF domain-containing protein, partial [Tepidisphaeraceae bacterium]
MSTATTSPGLIRKLDEMQARYRSLQEQLNDPAILTNSARLVPITRESGQLEPVVSKYAEYQKARQAVE